MPGRQSKTRDAWILIALSEIQDPRQRARVPKVRRVHQVYKVRHVHRVRQMHRVCKVHRVRAARQMQPRRQVRYLFRAMEGSALRHSPTAVPLVHPTNRTHPATVAHPLHLVPAAQRVRPTQPVHLAHPLHPIPPSRRCHLENSRSSAMTTARLLSLRRARSGRRFLFAGRRPRSPACGRGRRSRQPGLKTANRRFTVVSRQQPRTTRGGRATSPSRPRHLQRAWVPRLSILCCLA